ncbi:MAG: carbon storage regulator, CsrA [Clostridia bacterium]|nr:carbon storage regulator, CsrA [Clostridia bacterium]HYE10525.1 carbon storage regulator CsrA [Patescibacteria group bacterium]
MLVLARKKNESILIGEDIEIIISDISDDKVKLAIKAPKSMKVFRKELLLEIEQENKKSAESDHIDIQKLNIAIKKNI